jgi:histidine ammonia-lyase
MADWQEALVLGAAPLTVEQVYEVAVGERPVVIDERVRGRLEASRKLVFELAEQDVPVYGLNRGVGWNKDKTVDPSFFAQFNRNLILSHSSGVAPYASRAETRAVMLARLHTLLSGHSGIQPAVAYRYADFLNLGIHPLLPLKGSVGAADITTVSHIGLAVIGEGDVEMGGERLSAMEALRRTGLEPLALGPKDGLAIVSSNALSAGTGALAICECRDLLETADLVCALSLEAIRGHVSPFEEAVHRVRPFPGQLRSASGIREALRGSDLWNDSDPDTLQDPLSFRDVCQIHGAAYDAVLYVKHQLELHLNSSEDNPCVLPEERRIVSCANFESVSWALGFEMLGIALHHVSRSACYRTIKLGTPAFTGLPRFLTADENRSIGYCTAQKTITSLDAEIRQMINPVSTDYYSLAGDIEDHAANTPLVVAKTRAIADRLSYIIGIEALHAAQAVDLRGGIKLGCGTEAVYRAIRSIVPLLDQDRRISDDIEKAGRLVRSGELLSRAKAALANS